MKLLEWHEKTVKKISQKNLGLAIFGKLAAIFILGALFSIDLVIITYPLLILSTVIIAYYIYSVFLKWHSNKKVMYGTHLLGFSGTAFLVLLFGTQSPHIPFKIPILIISILLIVPAWIQVFRGGKK